MSLRAWKGVRRGTKQGKATHIAQMRRAWSERSKRFMQKSQKSQCPRSCLYKITILFCFVFFNSKIKQNKLSNSHEKEQKKKMRSKGEAAVQQIQEEEEEEEEHTCARKNVQKGHMLLENNNWVQLLWNLLSFSHFFLCQ